MTDSAPRDADPQRRSTLAAVVVLAGIAVTILLVGRDQSAAVWPVVLLTVLLVAWLRSRPMELAFDVGQQERHRVVFRFNTFWGHLSITVDGLPVVRDLRMFSVTTTKTYQFSVGTTELHRVRIEKDRSVVFAGFRAQPVRAYVDDVLSADGSA